MPSYVSDDHSACAYCATGRSYKFRYAGPDCNVSASLGYETTPLGCDNHDTGDGVTRSVYTRCVTGADLPLPPGGFVVERFVTDQSSCVFF